MPKAKTPSQLKAAILKAWAKLKKKIKEYEATKNG